MRPFCLAACLTAVMAASGGARGQTLVIDALDGRDSVYTARLEQIAKSWPAAPLAGAGLSSLALTCVATPGTERYVGLVQRMTVHAALPAVERVLDDFEHYKDLIPDSVVIQVLPGSREGHRFASAWEKRVPVFFLPNVTYELSHAVDKTRPGLRVYRHKLRRSEKLLASDGMVVLEAMGSEATRLTEYEFFLIQPSPVPSWLLWRESLRATFLSGAAFKLKAENPTWSYAKVAEKARRWMDSESERLDQCLAERHSGKLE